MSDPRLVWCKCGYHFKPNAWHKIIMLLRGEYVKTCPRCQGKLHLVLYNFVVCKRREYITYEIWDKRFKR